MRQVVLDTETTGLELKLGHRVIEIGCVELVNRRRTARTLHHYLQPDRDIDPGAQEVHGISIEMLQDKPRFSEIADDFLGFIAGAELVIHNADFDVGFLNAELRRTGRSPATVTEVCPVVDTLALARRLHPGQRNSLDALCKRYSIDNSGREYHGALLDAHLLADVYLAMTGGQATLSLDRNSPEAGGRPSPPRPIDRSGLNLRVIRATPEELAEHEQHLQLIDKISHGKTLWRTNP
ncbi:MAG: DNA polymerase III subunit epsilon [Gammaproteobacteria bacterium]|nr:DNA polymerase III subunit epsilon [Gammaproteobacteria bacterium]MCP5139004.1 DNA polymerase III subunit epsilon [Chromatiales bacterium]